MTSMLVWGLNQCILTSFAAQLWTKNSTNFLNLGPTGMVEVEWWWIPLPFHQIWIFSNTLYMLRVDVETLSHGSGGCNQCTMTSFIAQLQPIWGQQEWWKWDDDGGSICPSTAHYERSQTPLMWMWEPFHVGLGQQPIHHHSICGPAATQEFHKLP